MQSDADRLAMIKSLGGQLARPKDGQPFWGLFDREFLLTGAVETRVTALNARSCDVASLDKEAPLEVDGEDFKIKRLEPDGTGMTLLILKRP